MIAKIDLKTYQFMNEQIELFNITYPENTVFYQDRLFVGGFSSYSAPLFYDLDSGDYEIINTGLDSFPGIRTAVLKDNMIHGFLNNALLKIDVKTGEQTLVQMDWPYHEPWKIKLIDGIYYFQDYANGIVATSDLHEFEDIPIYYNGLLRNMGGSSMTFSLNHNIVYMGIHNTEGRDQTTGYVTVDLSEQSIINIWDLDGYHYGAQGTISVSDLNDQIVSVAQIEGGFSDKPTLYISYDAGASFEVVADGVARDWDGFFYNGGLFYFKEDVLYRFDTDMRESKIVKSRFEYSPYGYSDRYLIMADESKSQIRLYDIKTFELLYTYDVKGDISSVWGIDVFDDYAIISANDLILIQIND